MTTDTTQAALIQVLDRHTSIETVEFLRIALPPSVENRPGATPELTAYAQKARDTKFDGDSFTETFLAIAEEQGGLDAALAVVGFHQPLSEAVETIQLARSDVDLDSLNDLAARTPDNQMLVVTSLVRTVLGARAHLPLLDLKLAARPDHDAIAASVAARLGGGFVVNSGSSYHLYGDRLMSDDEFTRWLLTAQLLTRCVDTRWVTHQLIEGRAALRLSRGGASHAVPRVIAEVAAL